MSLDFVGFTLEHLTRFSPFEEAESFSENRGHGRYFEVVIYAKGHGLHGDSYNLLMITLHESGRLHYKHNETVTGHGFDYQNDNIDALRVALQKYADVSVTAEMAETSNRDYLQTKSYQRICLMAKMAQNIYWPFFKQEAKAITAPKML